MNKGTKTTRWHRWEYLGQPWIDHALCKEHQHLPWAGKKSRTLDDREAEPTKEECAKMSAICDDCPVRLGFCAPYALTGHKGRGVDGGFYAGVWIPWVIDSHRDRSDRSIARIRELLKGST